jgi:hypothetical protein
MKQRQRKREKRILARAKRGIIPVARKKKGLFDFIQEIQ